MFGVVRTPHSARIFEFLGRALDVGQLAFDEAVIWPGDRISNVLVQQPSGNRLISATWGLFPESLGEWPAVLRSASAAVVPYPDSEFWKPCYQRQRCAVVASALMYAGTGEGHLLQAPTVFVLGGLYRQWERDHRTEYTVSLIVTPAAKSVSRFTGRWMPLFLPVQGNFIHRWLDPEAHELDRFREFVDRGEVPRQLQALPLRGDSSGQWLQSGDPVKLETAPTATR